MEKVAISKDLFKFLQITFSTIKRDVSLCGNDECIGYKTKHGYHAAY